MHHRLLNLFVWLGLSLVYGACTPIELKDSNTAAPQVFGTADTALQLISATSRGVDVYVDGNPFLITVREMCRFSGAEDFEICTYRDPAINFKNGSVGVFSSEYRGKSFELTLRTVRGDVNDPATILCQGTIEFPPASTKEGFRLYITQSQIDPSKVEVLRYDFTRPAPNPTGGNFYLRVLNLMEGPAGEKLENLKLTFQDSVVVPGLENIPYGKFTEYVPVRFGVYQFKAFAQDQLIEDYINTRLPVGTTIDAFREYYFVPVFSGRLGGAYTLILKNGAGPISERTPVYEYIVDSDFRQGIPEQYSLLQVVNAHPEYASVQVKVNGEQKEEGLLYGKATGLSISPSEEVRLEITDQNQQLLIDTSYLLPVQSLCVLYITPTRAPGEKGAQTIFYNYPTDVRIPGGFLLNDAVPAAYQRGTFNRLVGYGRGDVLLRFMNLSPDAGQVSVMSSDVTSLGTSETLRRANLSFGDREIGFNETGYFRIGDVGLLRYFINSSPVNMLERYPPPDNYFLRVSTPFPDSPGDPLGITAGNIFKPGGNRNPGIYTLALIGYINTQDPAKKARMVYIKHTN